MCIASAASATNASGRSVSSFQQHHEMWKYYQSTTKVHAQAEQNLMVRSPRSEHVSAGGDRGRTGESGARCPDPQQDHEEAAQRGVRGGHFRHAQAHFGCSLPGCKGPCQHAWSIQQVRPYLPCSSFVSLAMLEFWLCRAFRLALLLATLWPLGCVMIMLAVFAHPVPVLMMPLGDFLCHLWAALTDV